MLFSLILGKKIQTVNKHVCLLLLKLNLFVAPDGECLETSCDIIWIYFHFKPSDSSEPKIFINFIHQIFDYLLFVNLIIVIFII